MSHLGYERRYREVSGTSALPPRATVERTLSDVSKVPGAAVDARKVGLLHATN
jgi:hypothetical protein